jgi:ATP-dependent Lon protease
VSRENGIQLIDESVSTSNRVIGVVAQRDPSLNEPGFDGVYEYGCAVIIRTLVKMNDTVRLIVQGVQRFRIVERLSEEPYLRARIELIDEPATEGHSEEELEARRCVERLQHEAVALELDHFAGAGHRRKLLHDEGETAKRGGEPKVVIHIQTWTVRRKVLRERMHA